MAKWASPGKCCFAIALHLCLNHEHQRNPDKENCIYFCVSQSKSLEHSTCSQLKLSKRTSYQALCASPPVFYLRSRCSCSYCLFLLVIFHRAFKGCSKNSASPYKRVCLPHTLHIHSMFLLNSHLSSPPKTWARNLNKPPHHHCLQGEQKQQERGCSCLPAGTPLPRVQATACGGKPACLLPWCMCQNAAKVLAPAWQAPMLLLGNPPEWLLMVRIPSIPSSSLGKGSSTRAIWSQARRCHVPRHRRVLHCRPEDSFPNKLLLLRFSPCYLIFRHSSDLNIGTRQNSVIQPDCSTL